MILTLFACTGADPADTGPDTGSGVVWNCGVYAPQAVAWTTPGEVGYRSTFDYDGEPFGVGTIFYEGRGTEEREGLETWVHYSEGDATDAGGTRHQWTATTWYVCDELGLQQAWVEDTQTMTPPDGTPTESTASRVFDTRPVVYPPTLEVGTVWDFHAVYTESHSDGTTIEQDVTVEREAVAEEEVTVPAGTFTALHIVMTNEADGSEASLYTAKETGTVKSDEMQLTSHETFGP